MQVPYLEKELVLRPWEERRRELVDWFEMLQYSAHAFVWCGRALKGIKCDCYIGSAAVIGGEVGFAMAKDIDEKARAKALSSLTGVEKETRKIGLQITADTVNEVIEDLKKDSRRSFEWLHTQVEMIEKLVNKELRGKAFFYIPIERMGFWPKAKEPFAFGLEVGTSFPSSTFDVNSAATCLATTHATAAVFHLMRVLEIALRVLGEQFGVSLEHTNWAPAIEQIEKKIRDIPKDAVWRSKPDYKEQQEFYAQAASHFAILKDAWRNYTMHVRGKYTQEEAELIFENVKAFMQKLSERLDEPLIPLPPAGTP